MFIISENCKDRPLSGKLQIWFSHDNSIKENVRSQIISTDVNPN